MEVALMESQHSFQNELEMNVIETSNEQFDEDQIVQMTIKESIK